MSSSRFFAIVVLLPLFYLALQYGRRSLLDRRVAALPLGTRMEEVVKVLGRTTRQLHKASGPQDSTSTDIFTYRFGIPLELFSPQEWVLEFSDYKLSRKSLLISGYTEERKAGFKKVESDSGKQAVPPMTPSIPNQASAKDPQKQSPNLEKRLKLQLSEHWKDVTHLYEDATFTYRRTLPGSSGILQVRIAEYQGGKPPHPSEAELIEFSVASGRENHGGQLKGTLHGRNQLGTFGSAVFRSKDNAQATYYQAWFSTNGKDIVYVTYQTKSSPDKAELAEIEAIVEHLDFR